MTDRLDTVVIGAGVIGLAVARRLALAGRQVVVLEAEAREAMHTSSRNSEVIHAGIYYPRNSLKARLCVEGRRQLYDYCAQRRIPVRRTGKLIVACDESQLADLEEYRRRAKANGVLDLQPLVPRDVGVLEPAVRCVAALLSPSTGVIDSHAYITALRADLESAEGVIVFRSRVTNIEIGKKGFLLQLAEDDQPVVCTTLVNAAGLWAPGIAARIANFPRRQVPRHYYAKGHYFVLQGRSPFGRLVYPVAGGGGLGVHVTLDIAGSARFGPDVEWVDDIDYTFDETRKPAFVDAIRCYYPDLQADRLAPGYTGIRPKVSGALEPVADFIVQGPNVHGVPGLINLFGIESPGLTASLAIADLAHQAVSDRNYRIQVH